jgi:hypothetical protein
MWSTTGLEFWSIDFRFGRPCRRGIRSVVRVTTLGLGVFLDAPCGPQRIRWCDFESVWSPTCSSMACRTN